MIKYYKLGIDDYKEFQKQYIEDNNFEWWNGGSDLYETPVYPGDYVYMVVDEASRSIGEVDPNKCDDIEFIQYPDDDDDGDKSTITIHELMDGMPILASLKDADDDYDDDDDDDDDDYSDDDGAVVTKESSDGAYIITPSGLSVFYLGKTYVVGKDHINYSAVMKAVQINDYSAIDTLANMSNAVINFGIGRLIIREGVVYYNDEQLHGAIVATILKLIRDGFGIENLEKFLSNLELNPSRMAVQELYGFLEIGNLPITPDGCFLAYKKVRDDYMDIHSGAFSNTIGSVCSMPRNKVDDDSTRTCSTGLHVCSYGYLQHFGGTTGYRVVICKINPKDVVSIPIDYNFTKMRVCEYTVIAEDTEYTEKNSLFDMSLYEYNDDDDDDDDTEKYYCVDCGSEMDELDYYRNDGFCVDCR